MPSSHFLADEVDYLLQFISEWKILKNDSASKKTVPGQLSARNRLVRRVIEGFYERFPDRDSAQTDSNQYTYSQDERDNLTPRLKQWFINKTRESGGHEAQAQPKEKNNITPRMLVAKYHSAEINAIAKDLRVDDPSLNHMKAWNKATTVYMSTMSLEEQEKFDDLAEKVRNGASLDYADQEEEVLKQMLSMFPQKMHTHVKSWTRSMPIHMYCIAVFATPPESALRAYLAKRSAMSASMQGISNDEEGEQIQNLLLGWLERTYGRQPFGRPEHADPTVYPDASGNLHPMVPIVSQPSQLSRDTLRAWLRVYFNYLWQWQGGKGPVPWGKISRDSTHTYVEAERLPEGVLQLHDPHGLTKPVLLQWYQHIIGGQSSQIDESKIFQFATVDVGLGLAPKTYTLLLKTQDPESELRYAPDEKLYALKLAQGHDEPAASPSWRGLPLARTLDIYTPFDDATIEMMNQISSPDNKLKVLLMLLSELEKYGPVHTVEPGLPEPPSPLLPGSLSEVDVLSFLSSSLVPVPFFDCTHPEHDKHALTTFTCLCRSPHNQFRHSASNTWRGGPHGVRWIVIVIARIVITTQVARSPDSAPVELLRSVEAASLIRLEQQLHVFCDWVVDSLNCTMDILKLSHEPRSQLWKTTLTSRHLKNQMQPIDHLLPDPGPSTHGIPQRRDEVASMYFRLSTSDPDVTLGANNDLVDSPPSPPVAVRRPRRKPQIRGPKVQDSDSNSSGGEYIDLHEADQGDSEDNLLLNSLDLDSLIKDHEKQKTRNQSKTVSATPHISTEEDSVDLTTGADNALHIGSLTISPPTLPSKSDTESDEDPTAPILPADLSRPREPQDAEELQSIVASVHAAEAELPTVGVRRTERKHVRTLAAQIAIDLARPKTKSSKK